MSEELGSRRDTEITEKSELLEDFIHTKYGYCYYEVEEGRVPIIYNLYVHPEYRRSGHAKKLLNYVIEQIRSLGYMGKIDIEALPREQSISRNDLANFYEGMGLHVVENSPVNELAAEVEHLRKLIDDSFAFHPRAMKLIRKRKNFIVIAEDEPYFMVAYTMIRANEKENGRWTMEDEEAYQSFIIHPVGNEVGGEK